MREKIRLSHELDSTKWTKKCCRFGDYERILWYSKGEEGILDDKFHLESVCIANAPFNSKWITLKKKEKKENQICTSFIQKVNNKKNRSLATLWTGRFANEIGITIFWWISYRNWAEIFSSFELVHVKYMYRVITGT